MTAPPDVSVVMSVYNGALDLRETIESVLSQEGASFEFVAIDDGSTDGSGEILGEYARRDRRVRHLSHSNQGLTRSLIKGCKEARGRYIARQDAGDLSLPGRLRKQAVVLDQHEDCVFVSSWASWFGPKGEYLLTSKGKGLAHEPIRILSGSETWGVVDGPTTHGSVMFRKDAYFATGGYRDAFRYAEDWDLWYRLGDLGAFCMIPEDLYRFRVRGGSMSATRRVERTESARLCREALALRMQGQSDLRLLDQVRKTQSPQESPSERAEQDALSYYFIGKHLLMNGDYRAVQYFCLAVKAYPSLWRGSAGLFGALRNIATSRLRRFGLGAD
jgi:glycosyltransferase involved in cell wall biosynthesis